MHFSVVSKAVYFSVVSIKAVLLVYQLVYFSVVSKAVLLVYQLVHFSVVSKAVLLVYQLVHFSVVQKSATRQSTPHIVCLEMG